MSRTGITSGDFDFIIASFLYGFAAEPHSLSHTYSLTHTLTLPPTHTLTHKHPLTLSLSLSLSLSLTHTHKHTNTHAHGTQSQTRTALTTHTCLRTFEASRRMLPNRDEWFGARAPRDPNNTVRQGMNINHTEILIYIYTMNICTYIPI